MSADTPNGVQFVLGKLTVAVENLGDQFVAEARTAETHRTAVYDRLEATQAEVGAVKKEVQDLRARIDPLDADYQKNQLRETAKKWAIAFLKSSIGVVIQIATVVGVVAAIFASRSIGDVLAAFRGLGFGG